MLYKLICYISILTLIYLMKLHFCWYIAYKSVLFAYLYISYTWETKQALSQFLSVFYTHKVFLCVFHTKPYVPIFIKPFFFNRYLHDKFTGWSNCHKHFEKMKGQSLKTCFEKFWTFIRLIAINLIEQTILLFVLLDLVLV